MNDSTVYTIKTSANFQIEHGPGLIRFEEHDDRWAFFIDGCRIGARGTVEEARKAIDAHGAQEKKKPFTRIKAFLCSWQVIEAVEITSLTEDPKRVWVRKDSGSRSKEDVDNLFADTPDNREFIAEFNRLNDVISAGHKRQTEIRGRKLAHVLLPK